MTFVCTSDGTKLRQFVVLSNLLLAVTMLASLPLQYQIIDSSFRLWATGFLSCSFKWAESLLLWQACCSLWLLDQHNTLWAYSWATTSTICFKLAQITDYFPLNFNMALQEDCFSMASCLVQESFSRHKLCTEAKSKMKNWEQLYILPLMKPFQPQSPTGLCVLLICYCWQGLVFAAV